MFIILIHGQISETVLSGLSEHVKIFFTHLDLSLQMDNNNASLFQGHDVVHAGSPSFFLYSFNNNKFVLVVLLV